MTESKSGVDTLSDEQIENIATRKAYQYKSMVSLTVKERDALCQTVRALKAENERLLKLYNSAWLWVQRRVKHPNSGMPPVAMTLMEMLPLLPDSMRSACVEKVKSLARERVKQSKPNHKDHEYDQAVAHVLFQAADELETVTLETSATDKGDMNG